MDRSDPEDDGSMRRAREAPSAVREKTEEEAAVSALLLINVRRFSMIEAITPEVLRGTEDQTQVQRLRHIIQSIYKVPGCQ